MEAVSPWQFKNLGGDQDWVELSDTLWDYRWLQAINDVKPDIVEISMLFDIIAIIYHLQLLFSNVERLRRITLHRRHQSQC